MHNNTKNLQGFTIVELLIVIVVIGILAAITITSYRGITASAEQAALQTDIRNAQTALEIEKVKTGSYPTSGDDLKTSTKTYLEYTSNGSSYCVTVSSPTSSSPLFVNQSNGTVSEGTCDGHGGAGSASSLAITSPTSLPTPYMMAATPYSYTLTKAGSGTISFSITGGTLPAGLSFNNTTGTISGTVENLTPATLTIAATNGTEHTTKNFTITPHPFDSCNAPLPASATPTLSGTTLTLQMRVTLCGASTHLAAIPTMQVFKQRDVSGASISFLGTTTNGYFTSTLSETERCDGVRIRFIYSGWTSEWTSVVKATC